MSDEKELRAFISHDIYRELDHLNSNWGLYIDAINRAKNWCITLFMVAIGFCLAEKKNELIFYFFPLIPVVWFWVYAAYQRFCADITTQKKNNEDRLNILYNLHLFSKEVLRQKIEKIKEIQESHIDKKDKEGFNLCRFLDEKVNRNRFFKKKFPGILESACHLEYLLFFGTGITLWVIVAFLIYLAASL